MHNLGVNLILKGGKCRDLISFYFLDVAFPGLTLVRGICLSTLNYIVWEPLVHVLHNLKIPHDSFSFHYHVKFDLKLVCSRLAHAVLVALINNSYDEVHADQVSEDHENKPDENRELVVVSI